MLERATVRTRRSVAEIDRDIREFHEKHGADSNESRSVRNAFWRCQGTTDLLEAMYQHTLVCGACKGRVEDQLASYQGQHYSPK